MSDECQKMHCGEEGCCRGVLYPECQVTICGDDDGSPVH